MKRMTIKHGVVALFAGLVVSGSVGKTSLSLELLMQERRPLNKDCYAANLQLHYGPLWYNHPDFIDLYREADKPFLRYPGGTTANFYHPESGLLSTDTPYTKHDFSELNESILQKKMHGWNTDAGFLEFSRQTGARSSVVLNICTRTLEENRAWLESVKARGGEPTHFEIGNELYYTFFEWAESAKSARAYINRAKQSAHMIRSIFPAAKVGVVVPSHIYMFESYGGRQDQLPRRMQEWYDAMQQEAFFDAVIIHLYSQIGMKPGTREEDFISVAQGYKNVIGYAERNLDSALDLLEIRFPGKEIWVTEYGVNGFNGTLGEYGLRESHLGCLHSDLMLMRYLSRPSVTLAHWHSLNQFYTYRHGSNPGINVGRLNPYMHFKLFAAPVLESDQSVPVRFDPGTEVEAIGFAGKDKGYVIILNKRGGTHTLGTLDAGNPVRLLHAVQLTLPAGFPLEEAMEVSDQMDQVELTGDALQSLEFPPYSITRLEFTWGQGRKVARGLN